MIYLDHAATTKTRREAAEAMLSCMEQFYGNASAIHSAGAGAKKILHAARGEVASLIGASPSEIYFTSGGTEADNWAVKAVAEAYGDKGKHIITSKIEHHAILHSCEYLEKAGYRVTYLDVDENGLVRPEDVEKAIEPDTILISIQFANNEVGTIEPVAQIGKLAAERGILFHTDGVQAFGQIPMDVKELSIDLLSASAHKMGGPKGVGCLYIRDGIKMTALLHGGNQERNRRAGTENVPGIAGFGAAARVVSQKLQEEMEKTEKLRDYLIRRIREEIPECRLNGHPTLRLPGNVNFSFDHVVGESLLIRLDMEGICASVGSACTSGSLEPSHVLLAMGRSDAQALGALRMTIGAENTREELDRVVEQLKKIVESLRAMIGWTF